MTLSGGAPNSDSSETERARTLREARKQHIDRILKAAAFNLEEAAALLDLDIDELRTLMAELGIESPPDPL